MNKLFGALVSSVLLWGVFFSNGQSGYQAKADTGDSHHPVNVKPDFIKGDILVTEYDGITDDLLTAGLGAAAFQSATPPPFADPNNPTPAELRRRAIHSNYRALVDTSSAGGYGTLYGPTVGTSNPDGKIAGKEYLAYADDGSGEQNVTLMVQIPVTFDPANPCIVTAPSSGSRGIYGAIGTAGEWGLKKGCAVAYTNKGTGMGAHDLDTNTVNLINGVRQNVDVAGQASNFTAEFDDEFIQDHPDRLAFKHAHSRQNPEKDWGLNVLQSIKFAFYILNLPENFGHEEGGKVFQTIMPHNTLVIASSVSNGGGSSLRAAEQDHEHLIDGVAVSEPNVNPKVNKSLVIVQGDREWAFPNHSRSLLDYFTLLNLYQACANRAPDNLTAPLNLVSATLGANRCASLKAAGLLSATDTTGQAIEAQQIINDYGILAEQNFIQPSHHFLYVIDSIAVTYANAYGRFSVTDNLCGFSFAGVDATFKPAALTTAQLANLFSVGNGIPPTGGVQLINNNSLGGPLETRNSFSSAGVQDQNLEGALCLRRLATGRDEAGRPLKDEALEELHERIKEGIAQIRASGQLHRLPVVIVHGRNDAILPPNHTSRAYFGLNQIVEGKKSQLRYYEVTNAHHLDTLNGLAGFNSRLIPLHYYFIQALDLIYNHLKNGTLLPSSQVINTVPRGTNPDGTVPPITTANVPPIATSPADADKIITTQENGKLFVIIGGGGNSMAALALPDADPIYLPLITK